MRRLILCVAVAIVLVGVGQVQGNLVWQHTDDLWDISQGSVVTGHSGIAGWVSGNQIEKVFGVGSDQRGGLSETYMRDDKAAGFVHWIEWTTPEPITLKSFVLMAAHDGSPRDYRARGFSEFRLYAQTELIYSLTASNPFGTTPVPANSILESSGKLAHMHFAANLDEVVTSQHWRAEFVQPGDLYRGHANGPRLIELDGFDEPYPGIVPEPSSLTLLLLGALSLFGYKMHRKGRR